MQILSTNIAKPTTIIFNGQQVITGIYKTPTNQPIYLGKETVEGDEVSDRKHHGGEFKACYLFSENQYPYWKKLYPHLDWDYGMFGENLTVKNLDETQIYIGDIYKIGNALVQITQPREPCFKFGVKFGTQNVLKQFINHGYPGTYTRVLEEGFVKNGDELKLIEKAQNSLTTFQFFNLFFSKEKNQEHLKLAIENEALPISKRKKLKAFLT
ncbi:MOSC domain-containing protein [Mariniflexile sp.]|uniref:MOSC domain-containing protein n=1 Tax=Mariniflexile sp. TaxID=1979402 RepID=UPI004047EEB1